MRIRASDTENSNAVNSPGSMFLGSFSVRGTAVISVLLNVFGNGAFLKTPRNLKIYCNRDFHICNTGGYHERVCSAEQDTGTSDHYNEPMLCFHF